MLKINILKSKNKPISLSNIVKNYLRVLEVISSLSIDFNDTLRVGRKFKMSDKELRKQIMKIQTDSTPLEEPKNPDTCNLFALYKLITLPAQIAEMRANYKAGNYGYGTAKQAFYELLVAKYAVERERYNYYMNHLNEIDEVLEIGAKKARLIAQNVLQRVWKKLGY